MVAAGIATGRLELPRDGAPAGGDLDIEWSEADNNVYKTGPATEVFAGEIDL